LVALLRDRADTEPDRTAFVFATEDGEISLTYAQLDERARSVAVELGRQADPGGRALLLHSPGVDYIVAFFACLYARLIAVPAYPPSQREIGRAMPRLRAIIADCAPAVALCGASFAAAAAEIAVRDEIFGGLRWVPTDGPGLAAASDWTAPEPDPDDPAFIQYTSGSTASPRGVVLSHANLLHNLELIRRTFGQHRESVGCSWLPPYHDMGLIGGVLEPVYAGFPMVLMSPAAFVRDPAQWLRAISRHGVTTSGAPNFAYDLCVAKLRATDLSDVDLHSWRLAFSGAEPVRAATMRAFADGFAPLGFRYEAFHPCYGLAEATLLVSGGTRAGPVVRRFAAGDLAEGRARLDDVGRELVGCGTSAGDQELYVVDPESAMRCEPGAVGEIWVRGPSVARGYWRSEADPFGGALASGERGFLRTGDLGFFCDGELFVTGRRKDLVIVRGRNHHPHDIERTVAASHDALLSIGAVFTVEFDGEDRVVCVHEVHRHAADAELPAIAERARTAVAVEHGIAVHVVVLVRQASVPRTSSGKVQRGLCRERYLSAALDVRWHDEPGGGPGGERDRELAGESDGEPDGVQGVAATGGADLVQRLRSIVATALSLPVAHVDASAPLGGSGLDSLTAVAVAHAIEREVGVELPLTDLLGETSIAELAVLVGNATVAPAPTVRGTSNAPMSPAQRRLWFLQQLEPSSPAYHVSGAVRVRGALDPNALRHALALVVQRHEVLRTALVDGEQVVAAWLAPPFETVTLDAADVSAWLSEFVVRPFDLGRAGLLRVALLETGQDHHVLAVVAHHAVADGWSMGVLLRDLAAACRGDEPAPLAFQYGDVAAWRRETPGVDYWKRELTGVVPLALPTDRQRPSHPVHAGADQHFVIPVSWVSELTSLGRAENATLFMVLFATWLTLLSQHSGQSDLAVAVPVAGRDRHEFVDLIGCFVNTIVLRVQVDPAESFRELLRRVRVIALRGYSHQATPFDQVVNAVGADRLINRMPLADVLFSVRPQVSVAGVLPGVETELLEISTGSTKFDLALELVESGAGLHGRLQYATQLFDPATAGRFVDHFVALVGAIVDDPDAVARVPAPTGSVAEPGTFAGWPGHVPERFAQQVDATPDACAVEAEDGNLSYSELSVCAAAIAARVGGGQRVGLLLGRTTRYVAALLGVLAAGSAYVPLDPAEPAARIARMVERADVRIVVTTAEFATRLEGLPVEVVIGETEPGLIVDSGRDLPAPWPVGPESLAYVVFTSGSTGEPKGVAVEHRQLDSYLVGIEAVLAPRPGDRHAVVSALTADLCLTTLLLALVTGGTVVLVPAAVAIDPGALGAHLQRIDYLKITPSHLSAVLSPHVLPRRSLVLGGEPVEWRLVERVRELAPDLDLVNHYGPAETTVGVLAGRAGRWPTSSPPRSTLPTSPQSSSPQSTLPSATVALTHRIGGSTAYVLDHQRMPVPVGELYIGGPQVSRGYVGRPDLTQERFVPDPFSGGRMYRTGDRARVRPDGSIDILGRFDRQLKVRGYRVEPGEVEEALRAHPDIDAAAVSTRRGDLVGYIVPRQWPGPDDAQLREHLRSRLPAPFVPAGFARLTALPVTGNGKLDQAALDAHGVPSTTVVVVARSETERALTEIWRTVLDVEQVGVEDNFFDVGGHSLLLVELQRQIRQRLGHEMSVLDLMRITTVRGQAGHLDGATRGPAGHADATPNGETGPTDPTARGAAGDPDHEPRAGSSSRERADRRLAARADRPRPRREVTW
jgi:amino acid adenylation domain-containing protein